MRRIRIKLTGFEPHKRMRLDGTFESVHHIVFCEMSLFGNCHEMAVFPLFVYHLVDDCSEYVLCHFGYKEWVIMQLLLTKAVHQPSNKC